MFAAALNHICELVGRWPVSSPIIFALVESLIAGKEILASDR